MLKVDLFTLLFCEITPINKLEHVRRFWTSRACTTSYLEPESTVQTSSKHRIFYCHPSRRFLCYPIIQSYPTCHENYKAQCQTHQGGAVVSKICQETIRSESALKLVSILLFRSVWSALILRIPSFSAEDSQVFGHVLTTSHDSWLFPFSKSRWNESMNERTNRSSWFVNSMEIGHHEPPRRCMVPHMVMRHQHRGQSMAGVLNTSPLICWITHP